METEEPTKEQAKTLEKLKERYGREPDESSTVYKNEYIMVRYGGLWIGIEKDGYAHT